MDAGTIDSGLLELLGDGNWNGLARLTPLAEGQAAAIRFLFEPGSLFEVYVDRGEWQTTNYRRFGLYLGGRANPNLWSGIGEITSSGLAGEVTLLADRWYQLLIGIAPQGEFLAVAWDPERLDRRTEYRGHLGPEWAGQTWSFAIGADSGRVLFDDYQDIEFAELRVPQG
jgi:hypothetical protein